MNRCDRSERLPLRQVREHRKYHFLVDSSTSTSNDTNANHDDDTTATSFTTMASDNEIPDEAVFSVASSGSRYNNEPIFAVPTLCGCGQVSVTRPDDRYLQQPQRFLGKTLPFQPSRGGGAAAVGDGEGCRHSLVLLAGGTCVPSASSQHSSSVPIFDVSEMKARTTGDSGNCATDGVDHKSNLERRISNTTSAASRNPNEKSITATCPIETTPLTVTATTTTAAFSASPTTTTTTTTTSTTSPTESDAVLAAGSKSGVSPILLLWSLLTVLVAGTCTFAFLQPFWVMHLDLVHTFGMVSYCFMDVQVERSQEVCSAYGGYHHLANIPSGAWQAGCVLYGAGCVMLCVSSFLALSNLGMTDKHIPRVSLLAGYLQAIAVLIMTAGLLIFPLGFGSSFFRHYCGDFASAYDTGHCLIGWSYMLGIMGTALSVFCPFLSQFTDMHTGDIFS